MTPATSGGSTHAEIGQDVEEEIELDEQRRAADELDDEADRPRDQLVLRPAQDGEDEADDGGDDRAEDRRLDRDDEAAKQVRQDLPDEWPAPVHRRLLSRAVEAADRLVSSRRAV